MVVDFPFSFPCLFATMYEPKPALISNRVNDSCFIDIDITSGKSDIYNEVLRPSIAIKSVSYYEMKLKQQPYPYDEQPRHSILVIDSIPEEIGSLSIWEAAETGNLEALKYLIAYQENKANERGDSRDEEQEGKEDVINQRDPSTECTLLYTVIIANSHNPYPYLQFLLEHGADATARNIYNIQAIHALLLHCPEPMESLELLLDYDADPDARDGDGWSPVHYAARFCKTPEPVLRLLFKRGADINMLDHSNKRTALFGLLANGDYGKTLDWMIHEAKATVKVSADFSHQKKRGTVQGTLILQACKYGRLSCLRMLISSSSTMEILTPLVSQQELKMAMELISQQLRKATEKEQTEQLHIMLSIVKDLQKKLYPATTPGRFVTAANTDIHLEAHHEPNHMDIIELETPPPLERRPSLLKRFLMNSPF
ncbi:ankyrin repeat-containing domain protein [Mycotypha africana]|uniref:ankyrin repeat-containing domain protein n=1 Tax=Mycotypha africana TaxID=64632 RepID=UPI0023003D67|nr:ankyrin repeat-containing domain protein [Mycotypha africana]KAI8969281.1 ankyrin repeat-containing domain protein [Mycotypha africana]